MAARRDPYLSFNVQRRQRSIKGHRIKIIFIQIVSNVSLMKRYHLFNHPLNYGVMFEKVRRTMLKILNQHDGERLKILVENQAILPENIFIHVLNSLIIEEGSISSIKLCLL